MAQDRRTFLKSSGAALSAAAVGGCVPEGAGLAATTTSSLDPALLRSVADVVLPSDLGADGLEAAVQGFEAWATAHEPVAELNHGYGSSDIRYSPPDPVPGWQAQLEALELEAQRRHGDAFANLDATRRVGLLRRHVRDEAAGLPAPLGAEHVAVALMAHWFGSPEGVDSCYGRRVGPRTCRGIENSSAEPEEA